MSTALCTLASVVTWAAVFLLPVFVRTAAGRSALETGLALLPQGLITGLSTVLAPRLLTGLTVRVTVPAGFAVLAVASLGLLLVTKATSLWLIALILAHRAGHQPAAPGPDRTPAPRPARRREHAVQHLAADRRFVRHRPARRPVRRPVPNPRPGPRPAPDLLILAAIAGVGALAALALPAVRNTALSRD